MAKAQSYYKWAQDIGKASFGPYRGLTWRRFNHARAVKEFGQAIELNPEDATAYYNRGAPTLDCRTMHGPSRIWDRPSS
jgi:hypothetical protein